MTERIRSHSLIEVREAELTELPEEDVAVHCDWPLTSEALASRLEAFCGGSLSFLTPPRPSSRQRASSGNAPFFASRYERGGEGGLPQLPHG